MTKLLPEADRLLLERANVRAEVHTPGCEAPCPSCHARDLLAAREAEREAIARLVELLPLQQQAYGPLSVPQRKRLARLIRARGARG